jgi:hypothetical protein
MALSRSTELLAGLRDCLLTQVDAADADDVRDVVSRPGGGFVLVGDSALAKAQEFKRAGYDQPILADLRRYAGKRRVLGSAGFQQSWLNSTWAFRRSLPTLAMSVRMTPSRCTLFSAELHVLALVPSQRCPFTSHGWSENGARSI